MATEMVLIPKSTYDEWKKRGVKDLEEKEEVPQDNAVKKSNYNGISKASRDDEMDTFKKSNEPIDIKKKMNQDVMENNKDNDGENIEDMIDDFPLNYRLYAKRLLKYIKKNGGDVITWKNEDNTLIYRGMPQIGTDIIELVNYIFKTNSRKPKGIDSFNIGLKEIKTPKAYLKPYLLRPPGIPKSIFFKWVKY